MPADIVTKPGDQPQLYDAPVVYIKDDLTVATPWVAVEGMYCRSLTRRLNGLDTAQLEYEVGGGVRSAGGNQIAKRGPVDYRKKFVRIESNTHNLIWVGYILSDSYSHQMEENQPMRAVGLEYFLDREQVVGSWFVDPTDTGNETIGVNRIVPFNAKGGNTVATQTRLEGNRSTAPFQGIYGFSRDPSNVAVWSSEDILNYMGAFFSPRDTQGDPAPCDWDWDSVTAAYLGSYFPQFNPGGRTVYQILNSLISPRRGFAWTARYSEATGVKGTVYIEFHTLTKDPIVLPSGGVIPANANQQSLEISSDPTVMRHSLRASQVGSYNQVIVRGARITSTCTFKHDPSSPPLEFVADWTAADQTAYKEAAKNGTIAPPYAGLTTDEKKSRNDQWRRQERYARVYSAFKLAPDWNGLANGEIVFPKSILGGAANESLSYVTNWLRVKTKTNLVRGWGYADPANPESNTPAGSIPELSSPFLLLKASNAEGTQVYGFSEKLQTSDLRQPGDKTARLKASYGVYPLQDSPGIKIQSTLSAHLIADTSDWSDAEPSNYEPEITYEGGLFTVTLEGDHHAEGFWPEVPTFPGEPFEGLFIDLGNDYRIDWMVAGTVYDISEGQPAANAVGGFLRNDRLVMQDIARMAYEWYRTVKQELTVTWKQIFNEALFNLGMMITDLDPDQENSQVNTVVGRLDYRFAEGTTKMTTVGDQFDIKAVLT